MFAWWPDWRGECVAIAASGPSVKGANLEALRDRIHLIAIKKTIDLCPFADVVYGCDAAWWNHQRGLPDYQGLKLTWEGDASARPAQWSNLHRIKVVKTADRLLLDDPGVVGSGGNSGFQALNLAVQFGARQILLIGFDVHDRSGVHWYGRNNWANANNPDEHNFVRWRAAFANAADELSAHGIDVVNGSEISTLKCFRRRTIEQALAGWGL